MFIWSQTIHTILLINSYKDVMNAQLRKQHTPRTELSDWLSLLGYDFLSMAPDVSYTGVINAGPLTSDPVDIQTSRPPHQPMLAISSAFECSFSRDMRNILSVSAVPKSKVDKHDEHFFRLVNFFSCKCP